MRHGYAGALLAVVSVTVFAADSATQSAGRIVTTIRAVTVAPVKDGATVVIEANGPLLQPSSGSVNNPSRIYIDFPDVLPGPPVQSAPENPLVRRVRVAEHSLSPLVTRVVIDLTRSVAYRIDSSSLARGRLTVTLDAVTPARTPASPESRTPSSSKPQSAPASRDAGAPTARGAATATTQAAATAPSGQAAAERAYGVRVSAALVRLHALRPLLESIDRRVDPLLPVNLDAAVSELDAIGKLLDAIKPPRSREGTHALLRRTCTMGERAVRTRQDGARTNDQGAVLNAASAAAGALLMLDRANKELAGEGK